MKQLSILGCGWLGLPLAKSFIEKGWSVKGSTTSHDKIAVLKEAAVIPYHIELSQSKVTGEFENFLEGSEILIINIALKLSPHSYLERNGKLNISL